MRSARVTFTAILVTGRNMLTRSNSWNASLSACSEAMPPTRTTTGECATCAAATPVSRLVAPGPLVTRQTPGVPVTRASPSAMNADPCSWRQLMYSTALSS